MLSIFESRFLFFRRHLIVTAVLSAAGHMPDIRQTFIICKSSKLLKKVVGSVSRQQVDGFFHGFGYQWQ